MQGLLILGNTGQIVLPTQGSGAMRLLSFISLASLLIHQLYILLSVDGLDCLSGMKRVFLLLKFKSGHHGQSTTARSENNNVRQTV
jgi:hypothetical protein